MSCRKLLVPLSFFCSIILISTDKIIINPLDIPFFHQNFHAYHRIYNVNTLEALFPLSETMQQPSGLFLPILMVNNFLADSFIHFFNTFLWEFIL